MKKSKKEIFQDHLKSLEEERSYSPKGFLQPIYDLVGCKVNIKSNTFAGKKGVILTLEGVSQDYDERMGKNALTLKFETGSNLSLPLPSHVERLESGDLFLSFEKRDPFEDEANPYSKMRKNVKGYTVNKDGGFAEVVISIIEPPKDSV